MIDYMNAVADYLVSLPFAALLILKSSVVLLVGAGITLGLRSSAASMRYAVWALALAVTIALPIGMFAGPSVPVRIARAPEIVNNISVPGSEQSVTTTVANSAVSTTTNTITSSDLSTEQKLLLVWLAGSLLFVARMIVARLSMARIARDSKPLNDSRWTSMLLRESGRLGVKKRVRLFESDRVSTPLAAGITAPFIVLPADSNEWREDHREVVLRHELSHIGRGDAFICLLSGVACAIYWFNPLVWIAARRLRSEQEHACDDSVISLGTPPAEYAAHLLEVARSARDIGMSSFVSVAMARPSQLEGRLLAVLNERSRDRLTRTRGAGAVMVALVLLSAISAVRPIRAESAVIVASQAVPVLVFAEPEVKPVPTPAAIKEPDSTVWGDVAVESGGTLVLDLKTGAGVSIRGSDQNRVRVRGTLSGRDWQNTLFSISGNDRDAFVKLEYTRRGSQSSSHRMDITVPRRFNVRIQSAGGTVAIRNVDGTFTGNTGGGEIRIENARGSARLSTGGGPITVEDSHLSGSVSTGGGSVLIQNVTGGLSGSSGSGDVLYGGSSARGTGSGIGSGVGSGISGGVSGDVKGDVIGNVTGGVTFSESSSDGVHRGSDGKLYVNKSGGSVSIADAPRGASIHTGGGSITIGGAGGDVDAQTGGGDVSIASADGAAQITTGAGDVEVNVTSDGKPMVIYSGNGTVTLVLPKGISANLDLETAYTNNYRGATRIRSDWPLSVTETRDWDARMGTPRRYVRALQSVGGGGPVIKVRTVNGDIIIKRR
jgi:beta-lactamase regulating signal transducer with metallopeptidase domain